MNQSFKEYLVDQKINRIIFFSVFTIILLQFSVFKYFYPYAGFLHNDSFKYIETAYDNLDINLYMVGYSRFLRLFSVFSSSDLALVFFQYLLIQVCMFFFLATLFYFYNPGKFVRAVLVGFMVLNPLFLYMANMISSDAIFLAVSLLWFALLLWIINRPSMWIILLHTFTIFLAFTVRYNAVIYLFISIIAFVLSQQALKQKVFGILSSSIIIFLFVLYTGNKYQDLTGTWQYSPFGGWQLANNAMYAYRYVDQNDRKPVPIRLNGLNEAINSYFDSTRDVSRFPTETIKAGTFYMWRPELPLHKYMNSKFSKDTAAGELKRWASMGPLYKEYGIYIIKNYPWHFTKYFLWPNTLKYYAPPVEYLSAYNTASNYVDPIAKLWFGYKSTYVSTRTKDLKVRMLDFYPILAGMVNIIFVSSFLCFLTLRGFKRDLLFGKAIKLAAWLWISNLAFSIFSTAAALRFLAFPIMLMLTISLLLMDWMTKISTTERKNKLDVQNKQPREPTSSNAVYETGLDHEF